MDKVIIEKGTVQETLLIPLYGRKICNEAFPDLYNDSYADELIAKLDYDFSAMEKQSKSVFYKFGALEAGMRQLDVKWEIDDYIKSHPNASIVNMGCGLDQTGRAYLDGKRRIIRHSICRRSSQAGTMDLTAFLIPYRLEMIMNSADNLPAIYMMLM